MERGRLADVAPLLALRDQAARDLSARGIDQWRPGEIPAAALECRIDAGEVWVVRAGGAITGTVIVQWEDTFVWGDADGSDGSAGYIHFLITDRKRAPRGVGAQILAWAEDQIARRGRRLARLDCVAASVRLRSYYETAGYHFLRTVEFAETTWHPAALFEKALTRAGPG